MPWRRPRKAVERPINVSRSIEESLEEITAAEADDDAVELADLDGASITEAATGKPDDDRTPSELGAKLGAALDAGWRAGSASGAAPKPSLRDGDPPEPGALGAAARRRASS